MQDIKKFPILYLFSVERNLIEFSIKNYYSVLGWLFKLVASPFSVKVICLDKNEVKVAMSSDVRYTFVYLALLKHILNHSA